MLIYDYDHADIYEPHLEWGRMRLWNFGDGINHPTSAWTTKPKGIWRRRQPQPAGRRAALLAIENLSAFRARR